MNRRLGSSLAVVAALPLALVACGGGSSGGDEVQGVDDIEDATIQIRAEGPIRDPEIGPAIAMGSGSGFFISDDGLAVTNNHVVTGATSLEVKVGGSNATFDAEVVGVSECDDLALIQVDVDDPVPYFTWYEDDIDVGLDVYAAGFPLGDPEFTLTRGIVAKAEADGDITGTSSVDHTIEHDANIQPGNSGGPLVADDGRVVGVNYAGGAPGTSTEQFFAIAADLARDVVDDLESGDVDSLGINGQAVADDEQDLSGIYVAGVDAGSPADDAGILPGDLITRLGGLTVGEEGNYTEYCEVVRSAGDDAIGVEVLRLDTEEVLRGEINGDPLETAYSLAAEIEQEMGLGSGEAYDSYVEVVDDTGSISVEVPEAWSDVRTSSTVTDSGTEIPTISASTDLAAFNTTYGVPGMAFAAIPFEAPVGEALAEFAPAPGECTDAGVTDYDDGVFSGQYQVWEDCGSSGSAYVVLVSYLPDLPDATFVTAVQAVSEADLEVVDRIFATFDVLI